MTAEENNAASRLMGGFAAPVDAVPFEFVGTTSKRVEFCRSEFVNLSVPQITEEIRGVLRSIDPNVDYFEDDLILAANELHGFNGTQQ